MLRMHRWSGPPLLGTTRSSIVGQNFTVFPPWVFGPAVLPTSWMPISKRPIFRARKIR